MTSFQRDFATWAAICLGLLVLGLIGLAMGWTPQGLWAAIAMTSLMPVGGYLGGAWRRRREQRRTDSKRL